MTEDGDNGGVEDDCRGDVGMEDNTLLGMAVPEAERGPAFGGLGGKLLQLMVVIISKSDWCVDRFLVQ